MATIFPNSPVGKLPEATLRVFNFLKTLPDTCSVWHHLAPWQPDAPDFLVLNARQQALLVKVSPVTAKKGRSPLQMFLLEPGSQSSGTAAHDTLNTFLGSFQNGHGELSTKISGAVIFPNLKANQLQKPNLEQGSADFFWIGQEFLKRGSEKHWEQLFTKKSLEENQVQVLRTYFNPEVIVPASLTVCKAPDRNLDAGLTDFLLDYDQEKAVKTDLNLSDDRAALANDFRLNLVNGVAGSGKTLILLYRLRLLNELFPGKKFLVLTHNRPLIRDMESRYCRLSGGLPKNVHWFTFQKWCHYFWPKQPEWLDPLSLKERKELLQSMQRKYLKDMRLTLDMFQSELDWVKDQGITKQADYLAVDRKGRGFGLATSQRQQVFRTINQYDQALARIHRTDWATIPLQILQFIQSGQLKPPQYDVVLVDEAQFFAPVWFEIIQTLVKPQTGHLFLAADP
ncbi:MAG: DEAD/DEAH box helicase family protein, partial [Anaerolineales bacterium]|nr:DEAD/DEAH box helicase family protein [Anaerolineales bacterium]